MKTQLEQTRLKRRLTRAELAVKARVSERTVWNIEHAEPNDRYRLITREALSRALRVAADRLFGSDGSVR